MRESPSSDSPLEHGCTDGQAGFPGASLDSLEQYLLKPEPTDCSANCWEQLRDVAVGRMQRRDLVDEIRLRWGRVALSAISRKSRKESPQQAMAAAAHVRAYMITEFGVSDVDLARNLSALCTDILRELEMPLQVATRLAGEWRTLPREQMLQLRRIKNMLTPVLPLVALFEGNDPAVLDIRTWLELIPSLP
ncbi:hypothetical protein ACWGIN_16375 [Streptomyces sp. NPDC054861]